MNANSDTNPGTFTESRGKLFYNYDIKESIKIEDDGSERTVFDYIQAEIKSKEKGDIIRGIIAAVYDTDQEIALINNNNTGFADHAEEYQAYMTFRASVKASLA